MCDPVMAAKHHCCESLATDHFLHLPGPLFPGCLSASCLSNTSSSVFLLLCRTVAFIFLSCFKLLNISPQLDPFHIPGAENQGITTQLHRHVFPFHDGGQGSLPCSTATLLLLPWTIGCSPWLQAGKELVLYWMHCFLEGTFYKQLLFLKTGPRVLVSLHLLEGFALYQL